MLGEVPIDDPLSDPISHQYRRWVYPEPISDLRRWLEHRWEWFDPSHAHAVLWPGREPRADLDILVAGCGANQAAVLALTNPQARVTGIDVSQPSLDHERRLARTHRIDNLELQLLPIERVAELDRQFDLVISTGVLHHLRDPEKGLTALGRCVRPDGVVALMLYAAHGRIGVGMMQDAFRDLGLQQDERSLDVVRSTIQSLPRDHPLLAYLQIAGDLHHDAGLVDTFLNARDRNYTVDDCRALVESAGLVFDDWFLKAPYHDGPDLDPDLSAALAQLPRERRWAVMERINWRNGCHFFTACRPERPPATYVIDFASADADRFVPALRHRCAVTDDRIARYDWALPLDDRQMTLVRRMDGTRTLHEIAHEIASTEEARRLFHELWRLDLVSVRVPADASTEIEDQSPRQSSLRPKRASSSSI